MYKHGRYPKGDNHFHLMNLPVEEKIATQRLIDLGILTFASMCDGEYYEYAYHWTTFGYEVMKHMNIKQITSEEYKQRPEYEIRQEGKKEYYKNKEKYLKSKELNNK